MAIKSFITALLSLFLAITVFGQNYNAIEFIENKGQWDQRVRFTGAVPGGAFFIHKSGFTVVQSKPDELARVKEQMHGHAEGNSKKNAPALSRLSSHAYRVSFVDAAENPVIVADKPLPTYNNYFIGTDPAKWAANCKIYQGITLQNIYPNIDARYYSDGGKLKYDLIVKPGADLSKIGLKYEGADKLEIKNKELVIGTSVGVVKELSPYSYQYSDKGKQQVSVKYRLEGNIVRFDVKGFDAAKTLIIDPTFIFASYSGSTADNWGFTATYGPDGSMYGGGIVFGQGFPVNVGAYDGLYQAGGNFCSSGKGIDIGIIKLSPDGTNRIYATYIGGNNLDQPHSLFVDAQENLVLAGRSNSPDYPQKGGGTIGTGGGFDIIVTKLNAAGNDLIGSRRIGGSGDDGVNISECHASPSLLQQNYGDGGRSEVILDGGGNIYVASSTRSTNFPATAGAFQTASGGGTQDGVVLKFSPDVSSLLFASHLGGATEDAAYVLSINNANGNIYVAGGTNSANFPGVRVGSLNTTSQGIDGYVSMISNDGSALIRSTYIGTASTDQVYGIQFDRAGFPYIMGQTTGNWPVINAAWSMVGGKQFIAKLQPDLSAYVYSTKFGTNSTLPNISPVAFLVDRCENVYVSGWGGTVSGNYPSAGTTGLPIVNGLGLTINDGNDFYFFVLKKNASAQLYGDVFGQNGGSTDHVDGGTSRFDADGVIYQAMCANCDGGPGMQAGGSWSPTNASGQGCNLGMVKIALNLAGTSAAVQSSINGVPRDSAGCVPLTVDFRDTLLNAVTYEWDFNGDGTTDNITTGPATSYTYTAIGTYRVRLIAVDSTSCNIRDTSYINIKVGELEARPRYRAEKILPCEALGYQFVNTSVPPAARPFTSTSFIWNFGDGSPAVVAGGAPVSHTFPSPGTYIVRLTLVDSAYCNAPEVYTDTLRVASFVVARFTAPRNGCSPFTAAFKNASEGGQQFFWDFGDGSPVVRTPNATHIYSVSTVTTFNVTLRVIDSATCNVTDDTTIQVIVYPQPVALFSVSPQPPPVNTAATFTNLSSPDAVRFKWLFGDGDSLATTSRQPVEHEYNATKTYTALLIAYNINNCADTFLLPVRAIVEPSLDVPNAFTPLSGDENSRVYVRGFAIGKMKFVIWNRWGQKVFATENRKGGWDGKFKGVLQPMDVYAYTLEVEFTDGTKASKKGDITLIR